MRVLLTGAGGFVGSAIARRLQADGHDVVGTGRHVADVPGLYGLVEGNLADTMAARRMAERLERCEAIVHAAAALPGSRGGEHGLVIANCLGTQQIVALAASWEIRRLVYLSSLPVIGRPLSLPVTEDHPTAPAGAYHASKLFGEHLVGSSGLSAVSLRLTSVAGRGMRPHQLLAAFVSRAAAGTTLEVHGCGERCQDHVDVRDVADAAALSLSSAATGVLNIGAGRATSTLSLAGLCVAELGSSSEIRVGGQPDPLEHERWEVSIERARAHIGYVPSRDLRETIAWIAGGLPGR